MSVNIELPPHVEHAYRVAAQAKGMPLDDLVRQVLIDRQPPADSPEALFEQGLGLFGSPEDAALLDEVVSLAYEERRRPTRPSNAL
jgi:hypothetical protein